MYRVKRIIAEPTTGHSRWNYPTTHIYGRASFLRSPLSLPLSWRGRATVRSNFLGTCSLLFWFRLINLTIVGTSSRRGGTVWHKDDATMTRRFAREHSSPLVRDGNSRVDIYARPVLHITRSIFSQEPRSVLALPCKLLLRPNARNGCELSTVRERSNISKLLQTQRTSNAFVDTPKFIWESSTCVTRNTLKFHTSHFDNNSSRDFDTNNTGSIETNRMSPNISGTCGCPW